MRVIIDKEKCKGCRYCVMSCPKEVLGISDKFNTKGYHYTYVANEEECNFCASCFTFCPDVAIEIKEKK